MSDLTRSSPVPFFERLCALEGGYGDATSFDAAGLQASIARELAQLLNTRCNSTIDEFINCQGTVLDYGVPDFSALSSRSAPDLILLSQAVKHSIDMFEPRMAHAEVTASMDPVQTGRARLQIAGAVRLGLVLRRVDFSIPLNLSDGASGSI
jgi:type VI secretion system protein ImpF